MRAAPVVSLVAGALLSGCTFNDKLFYDWDDRRVLCSMSIDDDKPGFELAQVLDHLDEAAATGEVFNAYAHQPGLSIQLATIDHVLEAAEARGLDFVTYSELLDRTAPRAGLALAFDDDDVAGWLTIRDTLRRHGAHVTFFVTHYAAMTDEARAGIRQLASDGHDIEAHGVDHAHAPAYVAAHGLDAYLADEALPSIDVLVADGYPAVAFAYPFGERTEALDRALLEHVALVRTTAGPCPW
jgi:peptidoglycan/xylan/chitin deacetylase (PgdA/CDA1 family)